MSGTGGGLRVRIFLPTEARRVRRKRKTSTETYGTRLSTGRLHTPGHPADSRLRGLNHAPGRPGRRPARRDRGRTRRGPTP
eukprot:758096-Hanusia_phi.AAC.1